MKAKSYKTLSATEDIIEKKWWVVDVEGQPLGRVASQIAVLLRGKHKPYFSPHMDTGDHVVVINAEKVRLTGNKWNAKKYIRHTGYPGGQREIVAKDLMSKHPTRMIENAVKGMLPKNRLGRAIIKNMKIYAGPEHPHDSQQPEVFEI
ncbi:MAG: 50S ribosomal protein L13 [Bacteroidota bacterium]